MEPHWVDDREREPDLDKEVQVMVGKFFPGGADIGYARAKLTPQGWAFLTSPISTQVLAWLESDRFLDGKELSDVPKDKIRI